MTSNQLKEQPDLRKAINKFHKACIKKSWKGSMPPDEHAAINAYFHRAKENLYKVIARITEL